MRARRFDVAMALMVLLVVGLLPQPSWAGHGPMFGPRWWGEDDKTLEVRFRVDFPTTDAWRARVLDGGTAWSNLAGYPNFVQGGDIGTQFTFMAGCAPRGKVTVHWTQFSRYDALPDSWLGASNFCVYDDNPGQRYSSKVAINSDRAADFYTGGLADIPDNQWDLLSVTTKMMGNVAALGHYSNNDPNCANTSSQYTMCFNTYKNTTYKRSLHQHDIDTFQRIYAQGGY